MNRLKMVRLLKGFTQVKLMRACGIFHTSISRFENGWILPSNEQKSALSDALGVDKDWLFPKTTKDENF